MTWPKSCAILLFQTLSNLCWCSESATPCYRSFNLCVKNMSTLWWSSELFSNLRNRLWENLSCYKKILLLLLFLISVITAIYWLAKMKTLNEKLIPLLELLEILELANLSTFSTDPDHLCEKCSLHSEKSIQEIIL